MTAVTEVVERGRLCIPPAALTEWRTLAIAIAVQGPASCETKAEADLWWSGAVDDLAIAVAMCGSCPVQPECRAYALAAGEREGVWGGLTPAERAR